MQENNIVIYMHTSPSGKSYIGQTNNYEKRCREHQTHTGCRAFYSAIKRYGWENFKHEILLSGLSIDEANRLEVEQISIFNTVSPHGYNLRSGGDSSVPSDETRALMRESRSRQVMAVVSDETRLKMSIAHTGRKHTKESKAKMSASQRKVKKNPESIAKMAATKRGSKHSEETKAKMSAARKGRIFSSEHRERLSAAAKKREELRRQAITPNIAD